MMNIGLPELLIVCAIPLLGVILIAALALLVSWLVRQGNAAVTMRAAPRETPLEVLKGRYARGELTKEQFEQMKKDLES